MTAPKGAERPDKPPGFALSPASNGQWVKRYKGKLYSCGPWSDPNAALFRWWEILRDLDSTQAPEDAPVTLLDVVDEYLSSQMRRVVTGDLAQRTMSDYGYWAEWLLTSLGEETVVANLKARDFDMLRVDFPSTWGVHMIRHCVTHIRHIFSWAHKTELIPLPVNFGTTFILPSKKRVKHEKRERGKKLWEMEEIHHLMHHACPQMRAMIMLGLNAAYINIDCSRLLQSQATTEWLSVPRVKTGEDRKAWLWPETRVAMEEAIDDHGRDDLVFLHDNGRPWSDEDTARCQITFAFRELKRKAGIVKPGVGFAALRHTFRTVADECGDYPAVRYVMGHKDETGSAMDAIYREGISDDRIKAVGKFVLAWYN